MKCDVAERALSVAMDQTLAPGSAVLYNCVLSW